jgi:hypothetical protein
MKLAKLVSVIACISIQPLSLSAQIVDLTDQIVLHIPCDGNALDRSGKNVSTLVSGAVLKNDRFGNPESAYSFDGIDDHINLNNNEPIITENTFSISLWVKLNGSSLAEINNNILFQQRDDDANSATARSIIHFSAGVNLRAYFVIRASEHPNNQSANPLTYDYSDFDEWHHYVAVKDQNNHMRIYIDAKLCAEGIYSEAGNFSTSIDHVDLGIHNYKGAIKGALNGCMDDIYIHNRAINECEILFLYSGTINEER